jgi:superfamily II DNA or RNA helicase
MSARNTDKQKTKRKARLKERRREKEVSDRKVQADYLLQDARWFRANGSFKKALNFLRRALKQDPENVQLLSELVYLGVHSKDPSVELEGLWALYEYGQIEDRDIPRLCDLLLGASRFEEALSTAEELVERLPEIKIVNKRKLRADLKRYQEYCKVRLAEAPFRKEVKAHRAAKRNASVTPIPAESQRTPATTPKEQIALPSSTVVLESVPVSLFFDRKSLEVVLTGGVNCSGLHYDVALAGHRIQFRDAFENLICLSSLKNIRSLWYQEETARKVLKRFRGRALLSDEVGLGKTIEAGIVLKEYFQRSMVRTVLILTPTPLVSQWKEELKTKFDLDFVSTDDADFRKVGSEFWWQPMILASINQAKSARNFETVTGREYDLVIVDEAHHLKNRSTVNWKLVNALKKRYLLLLTATPVENNLMELYNLITLLKPGQLKTASAFREEFMTKGDPTSPQNRTRLKELLSQVMIRNTRALAKLNIPPRFASTLRIEPTQAEKEWYDRINALVLDLHRDHCNSGKMLQKSLLAEAGSSPRAVELTLERMIGKAEIDNRHGAAIKSLYETTRTLQITAKNKAVLKLLRAGDDKLIIFVKYLGTLEQLSAFLTAQNVPHAVFHGGMDNHLKDREIDDFKNEKQVLVTTEIGGEGRNLQFCHRMINYDLPWNPMKIEQRIGRLHRIGQACEVQIYNLCSAGSIEDYILDILDRKINMFEMVIGEIDMVLGRVQGDKDFSELVYDIWVETPSPQDRQQSFDELGKRLKRFKTQYETTRALDEKLFGDTYEL